MSEESNIEVQQKFGEAVNNRDFAAFDDLVAADCVDNDPGPGQVAGPEGYKALFTELVTAFPDFALEVERLVANDTDVSFAYTATGTHQGPLMGHDATGRSVSFRGLQISRFENGKMVERWGSSDQLGMLQQLGLA